MFFFRGGRDFFDSKKKTQKLKKKNILSQTTTGRPRPAALPGRHALRLRLQGQQQHLQHSLRPERRWSRRRRPGVRRRRGEVQARALERERRAGASGADSGTREEREQGEGRGRGGSRLCSFLLFREERVRCFLCFLSLFHAKEDSKKNSPCFVEKEKQKIKKIGSRTLARAAPAAASGARTAC